VAANATEGPSAVVGGQNAGLPNLHAEIAIMQAGGDAAGGDAASVDSVRGMGADSAASVTNVPSSFSGVRLGLAPGSNGNFEGMCGEVDEDHDPDNDSTGMSSRASSLSSSGAVDIDDHLWSLESGLQSQWSEEAVLVPSSCR
jgi:hypothetical protein